MTRCLGFWAFKLTQNDRRHRERSNCVMQFKYEYMIYDNEAPYVKVTADCLQILAS